MYSPRFTLTDPFSNYHYDEHVSVKSTDIPAQYMILPSTDPILGSINSTALPFLLMLSHAQKSLGHTEPVVGHTFRRLSITRDINSTSLNTAIRCAQGRVANSLTTLSCATSRSNNWRLVLTIVTIVPSQVLLILIGFERKLTRISAAGSGCLNVSIGSFLLSHKVVLHLACITAPIACPKAR